MNAQNKIETDPEEDVLSIFAFAQVSNKDWVEAFMTSRSIPSDPLTRIIVSEGINRYMSKSRRWERLKTKITLIDPGALHRLGEDKTAAKRDARRRQAEERLRKANEYLEDTLKRLRGMTDSYKKWHLSDGTPLGQATKAHLLSESVLEDAKGEVHLRKANFYEALAERLDSDDQVLSVVVSEHDADQIRDRVFSLVAETA
jgi:response regulator RpfG family c-di-GMP phosphodiesterase